MTAKSIGDREEFRKYCEEQRLTSVLTKTCFQLFKNPDSMKQFSGALKNPVPPESLRLRNRLQNRNSDLEAENARLRKRKFRLEAEIEALKRNKTTRRREKVVSFPSDIDFTSGSDDLDDLDEVFEPDVDDLKVIEGTIKNILNIDDGSNRAQTDLLKGLLNIN